MLTSDLTAAALSLVAAISWGSGDFCGGLASRRASIRGVTILINALGVLIAVALALLRSEPFPTAIDLAWGAAAGVSGVVGLAALYRAMSMGKMGIAAPITGVVAPAVPVLVGTLIEGLPGPLKLAGFGLALVGIWLVSRSNGPVGLDRTVVLAIFSGLCFGGFFVLIDRVTTNAVFWPLAAAKLAAFAAMLLSALVSRQKWLPPGRLLRLLLLTAALDMAGNSFFMLATQTGRLDVASILGSLYPAFTVLLARLLLKEQVTRIQALGGSVILVAIPLIAV